MAGNRAEPFGRIVMRHTADETALLLAVILKRAGQTRARVSSRTLKLLAKRRTLRGAFVNDVQDALLDQGWALIEIDTGGFGVERTKLLEAAKTVTAKKWLDETTRRKLRRGDDLGPEVFAEFETEVRPDGETRNDEDE